MTNRNGKKTVPADSTTVNDNDKEFSTLYGELKESIEREIGFTISFEGIY